MLRLVLVRQELRGRERTKKNIIKVGEGTGRESSVDFDLVYRNTAYYGGDEVMNR